MYWDAIIREGRRGDEASMRMRDEGMRGREEESGQETTRRSIYDYVTRLSIELFNPFSTSRRLTTSPSNSHFPPASLYRYAKSA